MTSPLLRKPRITARGPNPWARKRVELAVVAWLLLGSLGQAQQVIRPYTPLPALPASSAPTAQVSPLPAPGATPFTHTVMQQPFPGRPIPGGQNLPGTD